MNSVKLIQIIEVLIKLQFILRVHAEVIENQLYPSYSIPLEDLPTFQLFPIISKCVQSFRYVRDGKKIYLGISGIKNQFIYAEVDKPYNTNKKCTLDAVPRKEMAYKDDGDFMFLINGCFIIDDLVFNGTLILMKEKWTVDFLKSGLTYFNISKAHTFDEKNYLLNQSVYLTHCPPIPCVYFAVPGLSSCKNVLSRMLQVDTEDVIWFSIILSVILIVAGIAFYLFWYRSE